MRAKNMIGRAAAAAGLTLMLAGIAAPALAETPWDLEGDLLVDEAGVLDPADELSLRGDLDTLFEDTDVTLRIVYVETFEDPSDAPGWANEAAQLTGMGSDDVLLAIATVDRNFAYSVDSDFPLSNAKIDEIASDRLIPALRDDDWALGGAEFTQGLRDALIPGPPWLLIGGGVIVAGVVAFYVIRWGIRAHRRRKARRAEKEKLERHEDEVDGLLVELDDSVKTSRQEIGFAAAQFGEDATAAFRQALEIAQGLLSEAFTARHALESDQHMSDSRRRAKLDEIAALCEKADATLDEQTEAFDQLRALEREAPHLRDELTAREPDLAAAIASARAVETELEERYGAEATASVEGSVAQAERLAAFVAVELQRAGEAITAGSAGIAAVRIRSAQQAVGQIDELVAAVPELADDIHSAVTELETIRTDTTSDIAVARATTLDDARDAAELLAAAVAAEQAIAGLPASPIDALAEAERINATLAEVQGRVDDRAIQRDRALIRLAAATESARQAVHRAGSFIQTRRGSVGPSARASLADAEKQYAASLAAATADDPIAALDAAQKASTGAATALRSARADVARRNRPPVRYDDYDDGAMTGGILGWLFGDGGDDGGSSRSGWSSSSRSSWGSSSRSRSRSRSSSSSSRRSSGSRRSSSRRSGGGRF